MRMLELPTPVCWIAGTSTRVPRLNGCTTAFALYFSAMSSCEGRQKFAVAPFPITISNGVVTISSSRFPMFTPPPFDVASEWCAEL
jgi:hypothetical protein